MLILSLLIKGRSFSRMDTTMIPDDLIGLTHRLDRAESFVSVENISMH